MSYRKLMAAGAAGTTAFLLAACSPASTSVTKDSSVDPVLSEVDEAAAEDLPPGFYLSGEFVELGPYDPNDQTVEWIRPCTEIPEEILSGTGLDLEFTAGSEFAGMNTCSASYRDEELGRTTILITGGPTLVEQLVQEGQTKIELPKLEMGNAVVHETSSSQDDTCSAAIDTSRGLLAVGIVNSNSDLSFEHKCLVALNQLESFYLMLRGEL